MTGLAWRIDLYYTHTFMGFGYEVVNGSRRDHWMKRASSAKRLGFDDIAIDYHMRALNAPGCAQAHRLGVRHA